MCSPGVGNPATAHDTYTLKDMSEQTLKVLRMRRDIACVLVNPLQALHPNANAPSDGALVDSGRRAGFDRAAYSAWLRQLRAVCTARGIVLIFDEVFVGFRLAPGGAQEYFGVRADMVTYGKTLGGGLPVGVVCGRAELMRRYRDERPGDVCLARGTFNSHPYVMGAMHEFLQRLASEPVQLMYRDLDAVWNGRAVQLNARLAAENLPVQVANLASIWTVGYTRPSQYNWMFQYYLRAHGLALSWVGTGRFIFSHNYTDEDFAEVADAHSRGGARHGPRRLVVVRSDPHQPRDPPPPAARSASGLVERFFVGRAHGHIIHRVDEFPAQQRQRGAVVQHHIVERVGDDLRDPHQTRLHVADEEQLYGAEQQTAKAHRQPQDADIADELSGGRRRLEHAEQRGAEPQHGGGQRPDGEQHDLALQVVAHLDVFLVLVGGVVDLVIALRLEEEVTRLAAYHGHQPAQHGREGRALPDDGVGSQEAQRADQVQRLIDAAVVIITMIVPALGLQRLPKTLHSNTSWFLNSVSDTAMKQISQNIYGNMTLRRWRTFSA